MHACNRAKIHLFSSALVTCFWPRHSLTRVDAKGVENVLPKLGTADVAKDNVAPALAGLGPVSLNIFLSDSALSNSALREIVARVVLVSSLLDSDKYPLSESTESGS